MAAGQLWYARIPASSAAWLPHGSDPGTFIPPGSYFIDVLPGLLLFGVGISLVVAPLTSTLMSSIPSRNAGLGSAINNALSRVGQPLLGAVIFIAVSATFFSSLGARTGLDTSSPEVRAEVSPLNPPHGSVSPDVATASRDASVDAFHLAAIVTAVLLVAGAGVNYVGLRDVGQRMAEADAGAEATPATST
jgi:hypothetical protein